MLGRPGQSNYAAANGFLDALARHRVGETFRTGNDLQEQALYGGPLDDPGPTVPDELSVTADGLSWTRG